MVLRVQNMQIYYINRIENNQDEFLAYVYEILLWYDRVPKDYILGIFIQKCCDQNFYCRF